MKQKLLPAAAAATLMFGTAPLTGSAEVSTKDLEENYLGVLDWTEEDFNNYLEENHNKSLDDFNSVEELEKEIGPVISDDLANGDLSDGNILTLMKKYNMNEEQLAAFLKENDNKDNIHFIGDLENEFADQGMAPGEENTESDSNNSNDQKSNDDNSSDNEQKDENKASEGENNQNNANDQQNADNNEAVDPSKLEQVYLEPLGWTKDQFNDYVEENYQKGLDDFDSFEDLQSTVGPVLTDENKQELLGEHGMTEDELNNLLKQYGEKPSDYHFVKELEEAINYYTSDEVNNAGTENGAEMPETATDSMGGILIGMSAVLLGGAMLIFRRKERQQ